ncbi:MAG TPA: zinc-binding alcohol dehydrogenase family protein [Tepidisphaeraceae bacterium]|jgi:NADPH2:quinone reductase|nr:zinc-binding alcohol dehydrogenase family protein [Tepidisphaeraceae bacterium]
MKAWLLEGFGGLQRMSMAQIPDVEPGRGEVVIKVKYAALNPADRFLAEGQYPAKPKWPHILGRDGMGEIVCTSHDCLGFQNGDKVIVLRSEIGVSRWGTLAEYVVVPAESVAPMPTDWSQEQAAAGPLVYLTAYQALTQWGDLPAQSIILVTGASGGVGVATLQVATAMGFRAIGLSRSADKRRRILELGAEQAFDPEDKMWVTHLKDHLNGKKVDLAVDSVAGPGFPSVIATLADHGKVSLVGRSAGEVPSFNTGTLFFKRLRIGGVAVGSYTPAQSQYAWTQIVSLLAKTGVRPIIDHIWDFSQTIEAFKALEQSPMGKVLIRVNPD